MTQILIVTLTIFLVAMMDKTRTVAVCPGHVVTACTTGPIPVQNFVMERRHIKLGALSVIMLAVVMVMVVAGLQFK